MSRDWQIQYGSFYVGGSQAPTRQIDGEVRHSLDNNFETTVVEFDFITTASTDAAFVAETNACENAFRIPRQDFIWTQAGQTKLSLKQSDNTGLDCNPTITKPGDPADTGRSIKYHVRLEFGRPADNMTEAAIPKGLRYDTITLSYSPSRQRTVTYDGIFTAYQGNGSYEQYLAQITAYCSAANTAIDAAATWEKVSEPKVDKNISDKFSNFTVVFKEVIANQGVNTRDVAELVDPIMFIDVERFSWDSSDDSGFQAGIGTNGSSGSQGGGSGTSAPGVNSGTDPTVVAIGNPPTATSPQGTEKPWVINVSYSVNVDKTVTTDLVTEYKNVIRPMLLAAAKSSASGAGLTLIEDKPEYDAYYNRISVSMQFIAYINSIIERHVTISDRTDFGVVLNGLWSAGAFDKYKWQGPGVKIRTILEEFVAIDTYNGAVMAMINSLAGNPTDNVPETSLGTSWVLKSREPKGTSINRGLSDGGDVKYIASWAIETILEYGNFRTSNTATAGTVNGGVAT